ncbi:hypothetical protein Caci_4464 [Catenulispora acidiphila DSM 44928]|uniref:Uncharacterized protein n=1 Tax=Catenulispora acidiphila (strain DSM 44928 / JCM 14897 / NBRC 102108 / NRRL B-24433 / ID139908) TaxID=479433 RepID=C7PW79_CATAD|nr:hypothetical protein [Catenulispora acidiphila]ACU73327.1 hypothetical protein Caci_4464 [Catenulispora acidiphila DSM 44928]
MATRRHPVLPTLALAAALGASALATTAAAEHAMARPDGTHTAKAFPSSHGEVGDWNTMVPEGGHPAPS